MYFVGVLCGVILLPWLIAAATIGRGLVDPYDRPILIVITIIGAVGIVVLELKARIAHATVADGQLQWRTMGSWRSGDLPIQSISRVEITPKGDVQIVFNNDPKLELSAKEFRRDDLARLVHAMSAAAGRDLSR